MAISKRTRFEIFKRDDFTCKYCGRKSPQTILEIDHIIPKSKNGPDDEMNLVTSCFDCNRGKSDQNLSQIITGEDPHDKAVEILERERQLQEYNVVRYGIELRINKEISWLEKNTRANGHVLAGIRRALYNHSIYDVHEALKIALEKAAHSVNCVPYFFGILKNWSNNGAHKISKT